MLRFPWGLVTCARGIACDCCAVGNGSNTPSTENSSGIKVSTSSVSHSSWRVALLHRDLRNRVPVTRGALGWRRLVKQHVFALEILYVFVTSPAPHILMGPFKRERGLVVVNQRWLPLPGEMTIDTAAGRTSVRELQAVRLFVAVFTLGRSC